MPTFSSAQVTDPFLSTNELLAPMLAYAERDSKLGNLDINRQRLGLEYQKLAQQREAGAALLGGGDAGGGGAAPPPADSTPFEQKMGAAEGGGTADKVNDAGYAGQFQFGAGRLADLGFYTPAPGENLKANEWKGKFNIAPYSVATLQDFLNNPAAQHAAFVSHVADIDKTIDATPGADKFDRNGLRAVAHLGGTAGMQAFVAAGGNLNRHDSNGTTLKNYYQRFADGGPASLQKAFGSVHGPGGPSSDLPAVQPGGNVGTAWVGPNAPVTASPVPSAPFNPNAGPRVAGAPPAGAPGPTVTGQADVPAPVTPSPVALRTGGTDFAGPGGGPVTMGPVEQPNTLYQTGLPGVSIRGPGNALAPPVAAAPVSAPAAPVTAPASAAPPGRPPILQPPPAPSRVIPMEPLIQSGPAAGLTDSQRRIAAAMITGGTPVADVGAHMAQWRQQNIAGQQQAATNAALEAQANFERQKYIREQQIEAEKTQYQRQQDTETARRNAAADARAAETQRLAQEAATRAVESQRLAQESGGRDTQRLDLEKKKFEQGSDQTERDAYTLRTSDPTSQQYTDAWARKKWTVAPNGNVIENDVSMYPAPSRSVQRPSFLPAPTPQALDEVRKADTDAKVITSGIDHYTDVFAATGGQNWGAYFDNPRSPQAQQLLGAFDRLKTVLRSPVYFNTGVLQPAEMAMMKQDLVSPESLRGLFATPQALATRLGEIKLAILTRQDAELRSIGKDGVIVRDASDFAKVQDGARYYDEEGHLHVKPGRK